MHHVKKLKKVRDDGAQGSERAIGYKKGALSYKQGTFNVSLFYSILRSGGDDPFVFRGGLYWSCSKSPKIREAMEWAAFHDPDGRQRLEYARCMWASRLPGVEAVELGLVHLR